MYDVKDIKIDGNDSLLNSFFLNKKKLRRYLCKIFKNYNENITNLIVEHK